MTVRKQGHSVSIRPTHKRKRIPESKGIICHCGCVAGRGCDSVTENDCSRMWMLMYAKAQSSVDIID